MFQLGEGRENNLSVWSFECECVYTVPPFMIANYSEMQP